MSMNELEDAFNLIEEYGGDFAGEKTLDLVNKAEKRLDVNFSPTYKKFLLRYGCGDVEGLELYGIISDDFDHSGIPDAVWLTIEERKIGLPKELVIISAVGDGTYFVLDTSQVSSDFESPICTYDTSGKQSRVYEDYGNFLLSELKLIL